MSTPELLPSHLLIHNLHNPRAYIFLLAREADSVRQSRPRLQLRANVKGGVSRHDFLQLDLPSSAAAAYAKMYQT